MKLHMTLTTKSRLKCNTVLQLRLLFLPPLEHYGRNFLILSKYYEAFLSSKYQNIWYILNHKTTKITIFTIVIQNMTFYWQTYRIIFPMKDEKVSDIYWTKFINSCNSVEAPLRFLILTLSHVNGEWTHVSPLK